MAPGSPRKESDPHAPPFRIIGFDLSGFGETVQLIILALGHIGCATAFALLQEKVFRIEGFKYGGFMALFETSTYVCCALLELYLSGDMMPKAKLQNYAFLSFFTYSGMYLTNSSLKYLSYPTRVMFKSSKVIPVMFMGIVYMGKRYTKAHYANVAVLVTGIVMFTMGDIDTSPTFDIIGIFLITGGVLFDSFTATYEEKVFFKTYGCSHAEIMCFTSLISSIWSFFLLKSTGELDEAIVHAYEHTEVVYLMILFSAVNYFSVSFILLLISHFGSANAEIVKSTRKVLSIVMSYLAYSKPFTSWHIRGGVLFISSIVFGFYLKSRSKRHAHPNVKLTQNGTTA